jgi:hypothetical protein
MDSLWDFFPKGCAIGSLIISEGHIYKVHGANFFVNMKKLQFKGESKITKKTKIKLKSKKEEDAPVVEGWVMAISTSDINGPCLIISIANNNPQLLNWY